MSTQEEIEKIEELQISFEQREYEIDLGTIKLNQPKTIIVKFDKKIIEEYSKNISKIIIYEIQL